MELSYVKAKVGRREFQSLQNLADSVPVSPPSLSSAIRKGIVERLLSMICYRYDKCQKKG